MTASTNRSVRRSASARRSVPHLAVALVSLTAMLTASGCFEDDFGASVDNIADADSTGDGTAVADLHEDALPDDATVTTDDIVWQDDVAQDVWQPCPLGDTCPCSQDADCASGACIAVDDGAGGKLQQCAVPCVDGVCPPGLFCTELPGEGPDGGTLEVCLPVTDACDPGDEICDGLDNDCDGVTDEGGCDDDQPCTDDTCGGRTGCVHVANTASCDDGDACTDNDACGGGVCNGGAAPTCDDGDACTVDTCNPIDKGCSHAAIEGPCDDGDPCTVADHCADGSCAGVVVECDDGNPCTNDVCEPDFGACQHKPLPDFTVCDDGDACSSDDHCDHDALCSGLPVDCDDGNPCTADVCVSEDGCHALPDSGASCSDGLACTKGDACIDGVCTGLGAKACDDANPCTTDACDAKTGCVHVSGDCP